MLHTPWYDGNVDGDSRVWDADDREVDLSQYTALVVAAVNAYRPMETLFGRISRWLKWPHR